MKKNVWKPGYEFIFSLSLLAILGLPPMLFAQGTKDVQITIVNGDTTVNGKNIKNLPAKERKEALKDIVTIDNGAKADIDLKKNGRGRHKMVVIEQKNYIGRDNMNQDSLTVKNWSMDKGPLIADNDMSPAGKTHNMRLKFMDKSDKDSTYAFNYRMDDGQATRRASGKSYRFYTSRKVGGEFNGKNTQVFNYTNTDAQGISTNVNYEVSEPSGAVNREAGVGEKPQLEVLELKDLVLAPQFEAGKTVISFSLASKAVAEVQFKDNQGNIIWSEKAVNGVFNKAFGLGLNGLYYLHVKQGSRLAVKKIMKD